MADFDFIAIGGGNTGLAAAYRVAGAGRKVALADRGPVGGLCSLAGCNPKKVLVRATEVLDAVRHAGAHGIDLTIGRIDWSRVIDRKKSFTDPVTPATEESLRKEGVELIRGEARFLSADTLRVGNRELRAEGFMVATGSTPRRLSFPGADLVQTSDDILELREVPRDLVIIGAGVVAFEFGQVFARLGSKVAVLMPGDQALRGMDQELVGALVEHSERLGISFVEKARVRAARRCVGRLCVEAEVGGQEREFPADFALNAAGRVPAVGELDLPAAGASSDGRGVVVDDYLRSPGNRRVFAGGDAHGKRQLSPVASYEGLVAAKNFLEGDVERVRYDAIPQAVYTVPPLAAVGMTEEEARKAGRDVTVTSHDMDDWKVYAIAGERPARSKVIVESASRRILGAHFLGPGSADIIHVFAMAIRFDLTADDLGKMVWAYPTFSSALGSTLG